MPKQKGKNGAEVIPLRPDISCSAAAGFVCDSVRSIYQLVEGGITKTESTTLFLFLDEKKRLIVSKPVDFFKPFDDDSVGFFINDIEFEYHEAVCVIPKFDEPCGWRDDKYYKDLYSKLSLFFATIKKRFSELYLYGSDRIYGVGHGKLFCFSPYPVSNKDQSNSKNLYSLPTVPNCEDERYFLQVYRGLSPKWKKQFRVSARILEGIHKEERAVLKIVKEGKPLDDEQANCWAGIIDEVISGELHA